MYWKSNSFFLTSYTLSSYYSTRGIDGELLLCFLLFGGITLLYLGFILFNANIKYRNVFLSCWIFGIGSYIGMLIDPHLEEMAGMLYVIIPMMMGCIMVLAMMTLFLKNRLNTPNNRRSSV